MPAPETITKSQLDQMIGQIVGEQVAALRKEFQEQGAQIAREHGTAALVDALKGAHQPPKVSSEKGLMLARLVRAKAGAAAESKVNGIPVTPADYAKRHFGERDEVTKALTSTDFSAGGALTSTPFAAEFIDLLREASVVRRLGARTVPMPNGSLAIRKLVAGGTGGWIGESGTAGRMPNTQQQVGVLQLVKKKLGAQTIVSNDLLRTADVSADQIVRDDLRASIGLSEDLAFIRGTGTAFTPKGLRYFAPTANPDHVNAANGTVNLANVTSDLGSLVLKLRRAKVQFVTPAWLMAPGSWNYLMTVRDGNGNFAFREEMMAGRLWGWPFGVTTQIPENLGGGSNESEVYLVDMANAIIGETLQLELVASSEAAYHDGTNVQAAFSQDETVIRAIREVDFGMRHDESVAVLTGVTWT